MAAHPITSPCHLVIGTAGALRIAIPRRRVDATNKPSCRAAHILRCRHSAFEIWLPRLISDVVRPFASDAPLTNNVRGSLPFSQSLTWTCRVGCNRRAVGSLRHGRYRLDVRAGRNGTLQFRASFDARFQSHSTCECRCRLCRDVRWTGCPCRPTRPAERRPMCPPFLAAPGIRWVLLPPVHTHSNPDNPPLQASEWSFIGARAEFADAGADEHLSKMCHVRSRVIEGCRQDRWHDRLRTGARS